MFNLFKCTHPAAYLTVYSAKPTVEDIDADFERVTFHMYCVKCDTKVDKATAALKGGVDKFLSSHKK